MLRIEYRRCRKCGRQYVWTGGGFISNPREYLDSGLCKRCVIKLTSDSFKKITDIFGK